jgi:hypothetical protein
MVQCTDNASTPAQDPPGQSALKQPVVSRTNLLRETAEHGRCTTDSQDGLGESLGPIPPSTEPRTKAQVLQERLERVQRLRRHYAEHYQACLDHVPALVASLQKAGHPVAMAGPCKRARTEAAANDQPATSSAQKPAASRNLFTAGLLPLGRAISGSAPPEDGAQQPSAPQASATLPDALPTFSDAEDEAADTASAEQPLSPTARTRVPLSAWLQSHATNLVGLADHERVAAAAASGDMDARDACAVLCGARRRFYVHQAVVLLGRESKSKGEVRATAPGPNNLDWRVRAKCGWPLQALHVAFRSASKVATRLECQPLQHPRASPGKPL